MWAIVKLIAEVARLLLRLFAKRQERIEDEQESPRAEIERTASAATAGDEQTVQDQISDWRRRGAVGSADRPGLRLYVPGDQTEDTTEDDRGPGGDGPSPAA